MKKVIKRIWPAKVLRGRQESPEKRTGVFTEFIMVKMEFEVTMGLYRKGACDKMNIKYLNTESNLKTVQGAPKSLIGQ